MQKPTNTQATGNEIDLNKNDKLTRAQRRAKERHMEEASKNANTVFQKLCDIYHSAFIYNNPDSVEMITMHDDLATKWMMYCKANKVLPEHHDIFKKYAKALRADYDQNKAEMLASSIKETTVVDYVEKVIENTTDVPLDKSPEFAVIQGTDFKKLVVESKEDESNSD